MSDSEDGSLLPSELAQIKIDIQKKKTELSHRDGDIVDLTRAEYRANKKKKDKMAEKIKRINIEKEILKTEINDLEEKERKLTLPKGAPPPVPEKRQDYKDKRPIGNSRSSRLKTQQPELEPEPEYESDEQTTEYEVYDADEEVHDADEEEGEKKSQGCFNCFRPSLRRQRHAARAKNTHKKLKKKQTKRRRKKNKQTKRRKKKKQTRRYKKLK
jgi:hypothetical protein